MGCEYISAGNGWVWLSFSLFEIGIRAPKAVQRIVSWMNGEEWSENRELKQRRIQEAVDQRLGHQRWISEPRYRICVIDTVLEMRKAQCQP